MVASYTTNGRITKQGTNDNPNTWGTVLNNQVIELFEEAIFGVADIDITGSADVTLTTVNGGTDQARHAVLELTGLLGADITLFLPATEKVYCVRGAWSGDYSVTLQISGSGTSIVLETGDAKIVYLNGTDIYDLVNVDATQFLQTANNLADLTDDAVARANLGLGDFAEKTVGTGFTDASGTVSVDFPTAPTFVGAVTAGAGSTVPSGWLLCEGVAVSRTTYADLFTAIGTTYGVGDGSTTFNLPDLRGEFIRGFDDGRGIDSGRTLGSFQDEEIKEHSHPGSKSFGAFGASGTTRFTGDGSGVTGLTGGDETRPRNIAMNYFIYTGV